VKHVIESVFQSSYPTINTDIEYGISTKELAKLSLTTPETIRVRLCKTGSYFGIRPKKLPNGRLLWPSDSLSLLLDVKEGGRE